MNFTEKANCGKLKSGFFNRRAPRYGSKPFLGLASNRSASLSKRDSTQSTNLNWGKYRHSISSSGVHSEASINNEDSRIVLALSEGRGEARCEVGLAVINVLQPHLILCQISDTQSYDNTLRKINIFNPSQILVPMTFVESANQSRLIEKVKEQFPQVSYTPVRRNTYNKTSGMEFIQELCVSSQNSILLVLQYRYYALTAASALFKFLQNNLNIFYANNSIKIDYQESEGYAVIDVSTADRLELVSSTKPLQASKYSTLFGVLNNCYTRIGERALRTLLLQPPYVTSIILERQQCVTALMRHPEKLQSIQVMLQKLGNVDQLLTLPTIVIDDSQSCSNRQLNYILYLNGLVNLIITLSDVVSTFDQQLFKNISETLKNQDFLDIRDSVRTLIHENAYAAKSHNGLLQRCFAIKPGVNGLLDLVRKIYSERLDDMREYVKTLADKYDLPLTLGNNITKGYHIVFSLNKHQRITMKKSDIPKEFIQICRLAGSFTMKTMELINFQTRIDDIIADILKISNVMIFKTLTSFKKQMGLFYRLCEDIALIDVMQSLAEVGIRNNYVKPTFANFTEVKDSQHPMLDMLAHEKPVPNLISCCQNFNVHIITGPNGSGKSIYIRQVMLLQVMAQIGSYVPASSAVFRPSDRLFARVYLEDNMECGASSFVLEMKEIIYILSNITESSLVIIDELARSTSLEEGAALAMAICECFVKTSAFVYLTSHFTLVTKLGDLYLNVKNWFMETEATGDRPQSLELNFKHCIKNGVTNLKRYGIFMVKNIWPSDILEDVYSLLEHNTKEQQEVRTKRISREDRLRYNVEADLQKYRGKGTRIRMSNFHHTELENSNMNVYTYDTNQKEEPLQGNFDYFDDTVPEDVLSEAVDQVEYSLIQEDSNDTSYKRLSCFIGENSENINLLNPEIRLSYEPSKELGINYGNTNKKIDTNPKIKILSNVLLNGNDEHPENNSSCNSNNNVDLEYYSNLRSCSQETDDNFQDFEEFNEINRSLLQEMQFVKENFSSENLYEVEKVDDREKHDFMDSLENSYKQEQHSGTNMQFKECSFNSFSREDNQTDFCFLKPSEPPLRKRINSKSPFKSDRENLNETDQITFSLGLLQNRNKTSTPIKSKQEQSMNFTNCSESQVDTFQSENEFSRNTSQISSNLINQPLNEGDESVGNKYKEDNNYNQQKFSEYSNGSTQRNERITRNVSHNENDQKDNNSLVDQDEHIIPKVFILQGPNNESLSFGEEDKKYGTVERTKLEEDILEETREFLSHSADIFFEDIDVLEISTENDQTNRRSHQEISENVISILKDEKISSRQQEIAPNDEIRIQGTQMTLTDTVGAKLNVPISIEMEERITQSNNCLLETKIKEHMEENCLNLVIDDNKKFSNDRKSTSDCYKKYPTEHLKPPENLFEESDLDSYLNNNLTISKERLELNKYQHKANLPEYNVDIKKDENGSKHEQNSFKSVTEEETESSRKNTVSRSLSEASRKRNLENSSSTTISHEPEGRINRIKYNLEIFNQKNNFHQPNTFIESPRNNEKVQADKSLMEMDKNDETYSGDKATTSISEASRRRNLDNPVSTSSSDVQNIYVKDKYKDSDSSSDTKFKTIYNEHQVTEIIKRCTKDSNDDDDKESRTNSTYYETAVDTDLSSISKRRNLDCSPSRKCNSDDEYQRKREENRMKETDCEIFEYSTNTLSELSSIPFESDLESSNINNGKIDTFLRNTSNDIGVTSKNNDEKSKINENFEDFSTSMNEDSLNPDGATSTSELRRTTKRKYLGYRRRPKEQQQVKKARKEETKKCKSIFKPVKLTKYQIQEEFDKQDQIVLEENLDVEVYNKYLIQRMNRPSIKQIQNAEHIATFRKTQNGTIVLPTNKQTYKPRKKIKTKMFDRNTPIDVSIFSDQNASKMSAFLASKERNYDRFEFKPDSQGFVGFGDDSLSRSINFCSQFMQRRKKVEFNRSKSFGEFKFQDFTRISRNDSFRLDAAVQSQQSDSSVNFLPSGFFKENKSDIDRICSKYLVGSPRFHRTNTSPLL